ncbi:MAG: 4a-hydroxytetrahydrobiopterin dehydratase [Myxococcales bacterium]|nr:4a-hydroxytetrahydrobiopterin dehydratase [Myxococcales bacterium]
MSAATKLSGAELAQLGIDHPDWQVVDGHHLVRHWVLPDFAAALAWGNAVGAIAEKLNHHPDIELGWGKLKVTIWSHDVDGLTARDVAFVQQVAQVQLAKSVFTFIAEASGNRRPQGEAEAL